GRADDVVTERFELGSQRHCVERLVVRDQDAQRRSHRPPPVEEYPGSADARHAPGVSDVGPDQRAGRSWSASEATMAGKPAWRTRRAWASASASVAKRPTRTRASSLPWT